MNTRILHPFRVYGCCLVSLLFSLAWHAPVQAKDSVKIALAGPLTGSYAQFGAQLEKGARMAAKHLNQMGGILGQQVEIVPGDDACDPKQARAVASNLVNQKVVAVVGHFCSSSTMPASDVYAEEQLLQITPASTNPKVTERNIPTLLRTCGRDDQQGTAAANYIVQKLKAKKVAIVHDKTTYGQGLADEAKKAMNAQGLKEVLYEGISIGDKDFSALVSKLKKAEVELIYFGGLHAEAALIVRQVRDQGLKALFMSGDGIMDKAFADVAGAASEGVLMTFQADPRNIASAKEIVTEFKQKEQYDPEGYTLVSYATMQVLAETYNAIKTFDSKKAADYIKSHSFNTVIGTLKFDAKGDLATSPYVIYRWSKGTYAEIGN
ncbi:MAG: branched-chain amino acid ABC transporter substrate-binding protein [Thermodesulfobacteriota bacterium]